MPGFIISSIPRRSRNVIVDFVYNRGISLVDVTEKQHFLPALGKSKCGLGLLLCMFVLLYVVYLKIKNIRNSPFVVLLRGAVAIWFWFCNLVWFYCNLVLGIEYVRPPWFLGVVTSQRTEPFRRTAPATDGHPHHIEGGGGVRHIPTRWKSSTRPGQIWALGFVGWKVG